MEQTESTKKFIQGVKTLLSEGIEDSRESIVKKLDWNKQTMSGVMNGKINVPEYIYAKFKKVYDLDTAEPDYREKYIALLEQQVAELKQRNDALANHVNSSFVEVRKQAVVNRAYLKTALHRLDDVLILLDRKTAPEKIRSHTDNLLAASQEGGS